MYRPVDPADPEVRELADSIRKHGILEPLVISADNFIISGHRRHCAAQIAEFAVVPVRVVAVVHDAHPDEFVRLLREHNRQRDKTTDEKLREEIVTVEPGAAYAALVEHRKAKARAPDSAGDIELGDRRGRKTISDAKVPFLNAVVKVLNDEREFWPMTDRRIHYALLNIRPLRHASKPDSGYENDVASYKDLCDLLTRARVEGRIPWHAIDDPTRTVQCWKVCRDPREFIREQTRELFRGYWRDLMVSQLNHIEIVAEKNTVHQIVNPVAMEFTIPLTVGRGYSSIPPRRAMAERFRKSGKEQLVAIFLTDFDPEGENIGQSFARSMRDDFGIEAIRPIKAALRADHVERFNLPPSMKAKAGSSRRAGFVEKHGDDVFELEAVPPATLQALLREAIEGVIDVAAYNAEQEREKADSAELEAYRDRAIRALGGDLLGGNVQ